MKHILLVVLAIIYMNHAPRGCAHQEPQPRNPPLEWPDNQATPPQ